VFSTNAYFEFLLKRSLVETHQKRQHFQQKS